MSAPAPRSSAAAVVSAVLKVMVSAPVPPVRVSVLPTVAELVPLASVRTSDPAPRSMLPLVSALPSVSVSAAVPPTTVSTLLRVPVFAELARVSLSAPAPRSTDMAVVRALPRVRASAPVPPTIVSTLLTEAALPPLASVRMSLPAPRSMLALLSTPVMTMVSLPTPEVRVSTALIVAVCAALPN